MQAVLILKCVYDNYYTCGQCIPMVQFTHWLEKSLHRCCYCWCSLSWLRVENIGIEFFESFFRPNSTIAILFKTFLLLVLDLFDACSILLHELLMTCSQLLGTTLHLTPRRVVLKSYRASAGRQIMGYLPALAKAD